MPKPVRPHIRQYFEKEVGLTVWMNEIQDFVEQINKKRPSVTGIRGAIYDLVQSGMNIEAIEPGHSWRYMPKKIQADKEEEVVTKEGKRLFELVHETKSGVLILTDEQGETYIVKPVDI